MWQKKKKRHQTTTTQSNATQFIEAIRKQSLGRRGGDSPDYGALRGTYRHLQAFAGSCKHLQALACTGWALTRHLPGTCQALPAGPLS